MSKIIVITTGGTIACTTDPNGALIPTVSGEALVQPLISRFDNTSIEVRELTRLDSASMTFADIDEIVLAVHDALEDPDVTGVVVTHGTDSMQETALAVDTFHSDHRPVVFTGAQKPFDHPESDALTNLFESIIIASDNSAKNLGVLIVFCHAVIPVRGCVKWHTTDELAFATNGPEEATRAEPLLPRPLKNTRIDIISAYPGAPRDLIDAAIASGTQGLVIEGMGAGNVGKEVALALEEALGKGIPVVITTRVPRGDVHGTYGGVGGGATLAAKGAIGSTYFRSGQARVLLAIAVATGTHPATLF